MERGIVPVAMSLSTKILISWGEVDEMAGLVLEGGSFRGIFSAGVMDALLDYDVK